MTITDSYETKNITLKDFVLAINRNQNSFRKFSNKEEHNPKRVKHIAKIVRNCDPCIKQHKKFVKNHERFPCKNWLKINN